MRDKGVFPTDSGGGSSGVGGCAGVETVGKESVGRELIHLALPILGANAVGLLDASVNAMWVGRYLGDAAFAAVSNANTLLLFLFAGSFGVWMAVAIRIGFHLGSGSIDDAKRLVRGTVWSLGAAGVLMALSLAILAAPLLKVLSVPADALLQAGQYLTTILLSVPLTYVYGVVVAALRGVRDTKTTFCFSLLAVTLDAGLNPVFIFGLGGLPRLGVEGAAWATVLAQAVTLTGLVAWLYRRRQFLCLRPNELAIRRADWREVKSLLRQGVPMGIEYLWGSILAMLMITLINRFGSDVVAAYGVAVQLWGYVTMPSMAIVLAATSMAAQSTGAKQWDRVRTITRLSVIFSLALTGMLLAVLEALNRSAFALFLSSGSPALATAGQINRVASWSCVIVAGYEALLSGPRATGAVWGPLALSVLTLGARLPIAVVLMQHWRADGIWWSFPISGVIAGIAVVLYYRRQARPASPYVLAPKAQPQQR